MDDNLIQKVGRVRRGEDDELIFEGAMCIYGVCISEKDFAERGDKFKKWEKAALKAKLESDIQKEIGERRRAAQYREHTEFTKWLASAPREYLRKVCEEYTIGDSYGFLIDNEGIDALITEGELVQGDYNVDDLALKLEELYK